MNLKEQKPKPKNVFNPIAEKIRNHFKLNEMSLTLKSELIQDPETGEWVWMTSLKDVLGPRRLTEPEKQEVTKILYYLITLRKLIDTATLREFSDVQLAEMFESATSIKLSRQFFQKQLKSDLRFYPDKKNVRNERKRKKLDEKLALKYKDL